MNAKQLNWNTANELAGKAVEAALGFSFTRPAEDQKVTTTLAEVKRVAQDAAVQALRLAGCLDADDRRNAEITERAANKAEREHRAWCKATGSRC